MFAGEGEFGFVDEIRELTFRLNSVRVTFYDSDLMRGKIVTRRQFAVALHLNPAKD